MTLWTLLQVCDPVDSLVVDHLVLAL